MKNLGINQVLHCIIGLPKNTHLAPNAKHLNTSEPLRIPPSIYISIYESFKASTISGKISIDALFFI